MANALKDLKIDPEKLRSARGARKLTEVAESIGITKQRLWNYESGLYSPPANVIAQLCFLYQVKIEEITTISENLLKKEYSAA